VCRDCLSNVPIIVGGPHTIVSQNITKEIYDWEYILIGESEDNFLELVRVLLGLSNTSTIREINGLVYKEEGKIRKNGGVPICKNLDDIPFPNLMDMYSFNVELKRKFKKVMIPASRGCPFKCTFCYKSLYYPKMRYRSVENIINEIKYNAYEYDITKFYFVDDSFGVNKNFLYKLCESMSLLPFDIKWSCMTHEKLINEERLEIMKKAGCSSIHLGIESGSDKILKLLGKGTTVEKIEKKCGLINEIELKVQAFFMIGMPTETEDDIKKSMALLKKIEPYEAILQIYVPYQNTKLYKYISPLRNATHNPEF
jgi:anaerobic magnesium-protoporphyrin IX monomethyl ester cyclase